jgi:hypothetical protein
MRATICSKTAGVKDLARNEDAFGLFADEATGP